MIYAEMRALLDETAEGLGLLFEHGLSDAGSMAEGIEALTRRFSESGLAHGAEKLSDLAGELTASRLDTAWKGEKAALLLSELWQYLAACRHRLDYAQAGLGEKSFCYAHSHFLRTDLQ